MKLFMLGAVVIYYCSITNPSRAQDLPDKSRQIIAPTSKFLSAIQRKAYCLDQQLCRQTDRYLAKLLQQESRLRKKIYCTDSVLAKTGCSNPQQYAALAQKIKGDTDITHVSSAGEYRPNTDSLLCMLYFMQNNSQSAANPQLQQTIRQLEILQAKMQDADQLKEYVRQRRQQVAAYIHQHPALSRLWTQQYRDMNQDLYAYSQQLQQYRDILNDPDQLQRKILSLLNQVPAFQSFMQQHSQLAGLFSLPVGYADAATLTGLQTRDQVSALIQSQTAAAGAGGQAALQASMQSAQTQLGSYKDKLSQLGVGGTDIDMPDFKPKSQPKSLWRNLEYGFNLQTSRNSYYFPTISDLGLSVAYKVSPGSVAGIGASYKLGWGNGINHIALSSQGVGLRSFLDIRIKGSLFASGGFEYNYTTPFRSMQQLHKWSDWSRSGLFGISKIISVKSRVFKKTKLQLLWDFLSYQQIPKTQPILFRIGYTL